MARTVADTLVSNFAQNISAQVTSPFASIASDAAGSLASKALSKIRDARKAAAEEAGEAASGGAGAGGNDGMDGADEAADADARKEKIAQLPLVLRILGGHTQSEGSAGGILFSEFFRNDQDLTASDQRKLAIRSVALKKQLMAQMTSPEAVRQRNIMANMNSDEAVRKRNERANRT